MVFTFNVPRPVRLDAVDDLLLQGVAQGLSLPEFAQKIGRSNTGAKKRLEALANEGYIEYNPGLRRSRKLTPKAVEYMRLNGLMPTQPVFNERGMQL